jgi:hypothetical protein
VPYSLVAKSEENKELPKKESVERQVKENKEKSPRQEPLKKENVDKQVQENKEKTPRQKKNTEAYAWLIYSLKLNLTLIGIVKKLLAVEGRKN